MRLTRPTNWRVSEWGFQSCKIHLGFFASNSYKQNSASDRGGADDLGLGRMGGSVSLYLNVCVHLYWQWVSAARFRALVNCISLQLFICWRVTWSDVVTLGTLVKSFHDQQEPRGPSKISHHGQTLIDRILDLHLTIQKETSVKLSPSPSSRTFSGRSMWWHFSYLCDFYFKRLVVSQGCECLFWGTWKVHQVVSSCGKRSSGLNAV